MKTIFIIFISFLFASNIYAQTKVAECSTASGDFIYFIFYDEKPTSSNIIIANNISVTKEINRSGIPAFKENDSRIEDDVKGITMQKQENSFLYKNDDYRILIKDFNGDSFNMEYQELFKVSSNLQFFTCKYFK